MPGFRIDGAASGLDFSAVIDAITSLQRRSVATLQSRIATQTSRQAALLDLSGALFGVQSAAASLATPELFMKSSASSSNEGLLLATSNLATVGTYAFEVKALAQAQQLRSGGFTSASAPLPAGELTMELGGQGLEGNTPLEQLRGGAGVDRGRMVLRQTVLGVTTATTVDLRDATGVADVVNTLNASGAPVAASVEGDRISLTYLGTGTLEVLNGAGDSTATDFGLTGPAMAAGETRRGANVNYATAATKLSALNDGAGVRQSAGVDFTVTATDGLSYGVDLAGATTVGDAIAAINTATGGAVTASLNAEGNAIELSDSAGGAGNLAVTPSAGSNAALDLGLTAPSELDGDPSAAAGRDFLSGNRILPDLNGLLSRTLNGGTSQFYPDGSAPSPLDIQGVASGSISVTDSSGTTTAVDLSARKRTGVVGVVDADTLEIAGGTDIRAGQVLRLTGAGVNEYATVVSTTDIGGGVFEVDFAAPVSAGVGAGAFRSRETLGELVAEINRAGSGRFAASVNPEGNGLTLTDLAGGPGTITVSESGATTARDLGLVNASTATGVTATTLSSTEFAGMDPMAFVGSTLTVTGGAGAGFTAEVTDFDSATGTLTLDADPAAAGVLAGDPFTLSSDPARVEGADVDAALLHDNTALASLNAGNGVQAGKIRVTDRAGISFTVDLSQPDDDTVFDVVDELNAAAASAGSSLRARINDQGDGVVLTQAAGAGAIRVDEVSGGRTARDLRLLGIASLSAPGVLDGTFEVRLAVASGETLGAVATRINALGIPVSAAVVNDGSTTAPFRLSLISGETGARGRVIHDTHIGSLQMQTVTEAQDARVLQGDTLLRSPSNTVTGAVAGMTLDLRGVGGPATVTVSADAESVKEEIRGLVDAVNAARDTIDKLGRFDPETNTPGILFGDPAVRAAERALGDLFTRSVSGLPSGSIRDFATLGVGIGQNGRLSLDEARLDANLASKPDEVRDFFTLARSLDSNTKLADFRNGLGVERTSAGDDFKITQHDGTSVSVSLAGVANVGQLLNKINTDSENTGDLVASIGPDGRTLQLVDSSAGASSFRVEPLGSSPSASQLGIQQAVDGSSLLTSASIDLSLDPGAARRVAERLATLTDAPGGLIDNRAEATSRSITDLRDRVARSEERIQSTIVRLQKRFAALEEFLSATNSTVSLLQAALVPLSAALRQGGRR